MKRVLQCCYCDGDIYENEWAYFIGRKVYCVYCMESFKHTVYDDEE